MCDVNAIDRSPPSGDTCESRSPNPYADASPAILGVVKGQSELRLGLYSIVPLLPEMLFHTPLPISTGLCEGEHSKGATDLTACAKTCHSIGVIQRKTLTVECSWIVGLP